VNFLLGAFVLLAAAAVAALGEEAKKDGKVALAQIAE